jgi:hypothetical protein
MSSSPAIDSRRLDLPTAALWASAFILSAMVIVQAGRLVWPLGATARADLVSGVGDYTALTFNSGNDDVLAVLDGRGEQLHAYRIQNQNRLELLRAYSLKELFDSGRRLGAGRK